MRVGIDLGGTKIAGVVLDEHGQELANARVPTPQGDYQATVEAIRDLVLQLEQAVQAQALATGVGTPGTLDPRSRRLRGCNSTCLNGQALQQDLEHALQRPVAMANDANCLLLSEAADGVAAGLNSAFGVILGTGVGGALMLGGQLHSGRHGIAGEWGHLPLPGRKGEGVCWCGRGPCIEAQLCGPALARRASQPSAEALAEALLRREPAATLAYVAWLEDLARALALIINIADPEMIVFGGGLSRLPQLYERLPALLRPHVFAPQVDTLLRPARHGDASGVRGAARLSH